MNRKQMECTTKELNQRDEVDNARIVEFLGKPHVHIDYTNGNIGTIDRQGTHRVTEVKQRQK